MTAKKKTTRKTTTTKKAPSKPKGARVAKKKAAKKTKNAAKKKKDGIVTVRFTQSQFTLLMALIAGLNYKAPKKRGWITRKVKGRGK